MCRECGYAGPCIDIEDDRAVPGLPKYYQIPPPVTDTTDFSRQGVIGPLLLIALLPGLMYIVRGTYP